MGPEPFPNPRYDILLLLLLLSVAFVVIIIIIMDNGKRE